jgi:hypothetical protein
LIGIAVSQYINLEVNSLEKGTICKKQSPEILVLKNQPNVFVIGNNMLSGQTDVTLLHCLLQWTTLRKTEEAKYNLRKGK